MYGTGLDSINGTHHIKNKIQPNYPSSALVESSSFLVSLRRNLLSPLRFKKNFLRPQLPLPSPSSIAGMACLHLRRPRARRLDSAAATWSFGARSMGREVARMGPWRWRRLGAEGFWPTTGLGTRTGRRCHRRRQHLRREHQQ
jgi:hypothetical protein